MSERKQRNSSIELMKIIALFFVVLCHSLPLYKIEGIQELTGYLDLSRSTISLQQLLLIVFSHLGQVGNALFIVPSAYFLLDNDEVKKEKVIQYILDTFIASIVYLVIILLSHGMISIKLLISSIFPITFNFYWFITCYILLYLIHPWLNTTIEDKKDKINHK